MMNGWRVTRPLQDFGIVTGCLYVLDRLLARISPRLRVYVYDFMVMPVSETALLSPRLARHVEVREMKSGEPEIALMPIRPEIIDGRFAQSAFPLGAFHKGRFMGYVWFAREAYREDEVRCTYVLAPTDEAVFDFDLYVVPKYRMGLGFAAVWEGAFAYLRARGVRFSFSRITRFNVASRRAHDHLGWRRVGSAVFLQAWRLEMMLASIFPYLHLSARTTRRVRLTLAPDVLLHR